MNEIVKVYNIQFLMVSSIVAGFIVYYIFLTMSWWKPLIAGCIFGVFSLLCFLPMVLRRIKEGKEERR